MFWALFCCFHVLTLLFVIFNQIYINFVVFCLTFNFLASGTYLNYFHPNIGLTPNFLRLVPNFGVLSTFLLFLYFTPNFRYFYPILYQFRGFLSYPQLSSVWNFSQIFSSQFRPYPNFWGLTPNFSVLGTFLQFASFNPNFRYLYPNLYQFRGFLSYLQLSSVWNLSQLFSSQFRPYPNFWGLNPNFSVLCTFLLFLCFKPNFCYLYPKLYQFRGLA